MKYDRLTLQVRLSAAVALRPALQFLLVTLIIIPVTALIGLLVRDDRQVDWKLSVAVGGVLGLIWFAATFLSTLADLRKEDRIGAARNPSFPAQSFVSGLYGVGTVFPLWAIIVFHRDNEPLWIQLLPTVFVALAFYGWPRTIHCDESFISQRSLFGLKKKIPYAAVQAISVDGQGTTTVLGAGTSIEHTPHHIDPGGFRDVLSRRSGRPVYQTEVTYR